MPSIIIVFLRYENKLVLLFNRRYTRDMKIFPPTYVCLKPCKLYVIFFTSRV